MLRITRLTQSIEDIAIRNKMIYFLFSFYYRWMVKREAYLANINEQDKILCIGGGYCPYTAILLHKYTKADVTVIDNDSMCIEKSKEFINDMGLNRIKVKLCDGTCVSCCDYTVIHIAMQISPKEVVLNEMIKRAQDGTRILIRRPKEGFKKLYSPISENKIGVIKHVKHGFLSNVDKTSVCVVDKKAPYKTLGAVS